MVGDARRATVAATNAKVENTAQTLRIGRVRSFRARQNAGMERRSRSRVRRDPTTIA